MSLAFWPCFSFLASSVMSCTWNSLTLLPFWHLGPLFSLTAVQPLLSDGLFCCLKHLIGGQVYIIRGESLSLLPLCCIMDLFILSSWMQAIKPKAFPIGQHFYFTFITFLFYFFYSLRPFSQLYSFWKLLIYDEKNNARAKKMTGTLSSYSWFVYLTYRNSSTFWEMSIFTTQNQMRRSIPLSYL